WQREDSRRLEAEPAGEQGENRPGGAADDASEAGAQLVRRDAHAAPDGPPPTSTWSRQKPSAMSRSAARRDGLGRDSVAPARASAAPSSGHPAWLITSTGRSRSVPPTDRRARTSGASMSGRRRSRMTNAGRGASANGGRCSRKARASVPLRTVETAKSGGE